MKTTFITIGLALILVLAGCTTIQREPVTNTIREYVCYDGNVVDSLSDCPSPENSEEEAAIHRGYETYIQELDFMGARGNELSGFGDGWIDNADCLNSTTAVERNYKTCELLSVELAFGSEPNPFKSGNAGYEDGTIFGNGAVFRLRCGCYR